MKHSLGGSSFNTDERHYCSTDDKIIKEETHIVYAWNTCEQRSASPFGSLCV